MGLSYDIISEFVKVTNGDKEKPKEGIVYATIVQASDGKYVKIDGSDLLTPTDTTTDIEDGERVTVMIKDHRATVTGNVTAPSASGNRVDKVVETVTEQIGVFETVVADKVSVNELEAYKATIENLIVGKADIEDLEATNAVIENLKVKDAEIENAIIDKADIEDLEAVNAVIENLKVKDAEIENLVADKATINDLNAVNADIQNLKVKHAQIEDLVADKADIEDLEATNAEIENLKVKDAEIENLVADKATIEDLEATKAEIEVLDADFAEIKTLVSGNLTSDNILSFNITADKVTMEDAFIKDAMIDTVNAAKINAGRINTNSVVIGSEDGGMRISGATQQFTDKNGNVRIQIGRDASNDFTFALYGEDGRGQLINQNGITASAIADGLIVNDMVSDNAAISGGKLDISSVVTEINNDNTTTINSNKIYLDEQNQSLEVAFKSLKTQVDTIKDIDSDLTTITDKIQSNTSKIEANKSSISTLLAEDAAIKKQVTDLEGNVVETTNTLTSKYTSLQQNLDGFKTTVNNTYATKTSVNDVKNNLSSNYSTTSAMNSAINQKVDEISASISSTYATKNEVKTIDDNIKANYSTTEQMSSAISVAKDEINLGVSQTYETKTNVTSKVNSAISTASSDATTKANNALNSAKSYADTKKSEAITSANNTLNTTIANYYTKTQTDSQINIAKDAINLGVSQTYETKTNVTSKVNSAISTASSDATTKANNALSSAKTYADTKKSEAITSANNTLNSTIANYYTRHETDSRINLTKDEINLGVSQTYETKDSVNNKMESTLSSAKTYADSQISLAKDAINLGVSNFKSEMMSASFTNLLYNSDFVKMENDFPKGYTRTNSTYVYNGGWLCPEGGKTIHIYTIGTGVTWQGFYSPNVRVNKDQTMTASVYVATENKDALQGLVGVEIEWVDANYQRISVSGYSCKLDQNHLWYRITTTGSAPEGTVYARVYCWNSFEGATWWGKPMLQIGSVCTAWNKGGDFENLDERLSSAEIKITSDAIVSTVTSSTTYKNNLTGKVDKTTIISSINQTAESVKINASKIELTGSVVVNAINGGSTLINGSKIQTGTISANSITSGTFQGTNFIAGGSSNGNGYFQVKDSSNDVKFHASKDGVYATKIQFPDSISISGSIIQSGNISASSSGFTTSGSESGSLYRMEYESNLGPLGLNISSQYYNTEGGANVAGTKRTIKISGDAIGFTAGSSYAQLSQSGTNVYSKGGYDSYNGYYCDGTMSLKKASHGGIDVGNTSTRVVICSNTTPVWWNGSTSYTVYTSGSKPTPADIGAAKALVSANGYQGMTLNDGSTSNWIRTTTNGLLPSASSGSSWPSSSSSLGTSSWRFSKGYVKEMYVNGLTNDLGDIWLTAKTGANTIYAQAKWLCPATSATTYLGSSEYRWHSVWAANGTIQTSDERFKVKQGFTNIDDCFEMIKNTDIYNYIMLNKSKEKLSKNRLGKMAMENSKNDVNIHIGIMAQDIQKYECSKGILIESEYEKEDGTTDTLLGINAYGLATAVMGGLKKEIQIRNEQYECLKRENEELKTRLANIERMLTRTLD